MSFDGIVTHAVVKELNDTIKGGRVDKIYQPEKDEILLFIHKTGINYKVVISASSNNPRIYLTDYNKKNPLSPPMFCMLLRKHLNGGIILNIEQYELDRVIFIDFSSIDELGQPKVKRLIIEIMGKHSNIILIDKDSLKIIDSIKRVTSEMSRIRQILPGNSYEHPPLGDKLNPLSVNFSDFSNFIGKENKNIQIYKFLYYNFLGLSPLISKEICFDTSLDMDRTLLSLSQEDILELYNSFSDTMIKVKHNHYSPLYIKEKNAIKAFHSLDLNQFGKNNKQYKDSISSVLDLYYHSTDVMDRINQKSQSIRKSIQVKLERAESKLGKQNQELLESMDRDKYKVYADLLSANLYKIPKGLDKIELENFYDENLEKILIPLDIKLSPSDNAQKYYKKYSKLKHANNLLLDQIPETNDEISYLENVLLSIENSTEINELEEIKEELMKEGYIKDTSKKKKKIKENISAPQHYLSRDGFHIYVGKNNRQNDYLTLKLAHKDDIWLHVQNMPGSHVVIKVAGSEIPPSTLEEAALLASYFSRGKNSNHVPVDYTLKKFVKKPNNAKPGMVIYDNFKTLIVNPSIDEVEKIAKVKD